MMQTDQPRAERGRSDDDETEIARMSDVMLIFPAGALVPV